MDKNRLRKIRSLYATKEMMQKAKNNLSVKRQIKRYLGDGKYGKVWEERVYKRYYRIQDHKGILKVAMFLQDDMKKGKKEPRYEIFLNPEGEEFITRVLEDGKEIRWSNAMIFNLSDNQWWDGEDWMNDSAKKELVDLLKPEECEKKGDGTDIIWRWQKRVREKERICREKRITDKWDEEMSVIPELPKDWDKWQRKNIPETFLFYETGKKEVYCFNCERTVSIKKPKHNKRMQCPHCKRKGELKNIGRMTKYEICTKYYSQYLLQDIQNGFCIRKFRTSMGFKNKDYTNPVVVTTEVKRILYQNGVRSAFNYEFYKNRDTRFAKETDSTYNLWYGADSVGIVYKNNLKRLEKGSLKMSGLPMLCRSECNPELQYELERRWPVLEKLAKVGLIKIVLDPAWRRDRGFGSRIIDELIDEKQTELSKILRIDNEKLKRLRKMNGNLTTLLWLQLEKKNGKPIGNEIIEKFGKAEVKPDEILFIADRMSVLQIWNYLEKQSEKEGRKIKDVLQEWKDYLNMAEKQKMRIDKEQIYRPSDLKAKHAEMVYLANKSNIEKEVLKIEKRFPHVNEYCQYIKKFEYNDGQFAVIAPGGVIDIFKEGTALQHCIHTCDFYFDRMDRRETFLMFLRKTSSIDSPWYTLEVEPSGNIRQKRTTGDNQNKDLEVAMKFLKKWQKEFQKRMNEEDKAAGEVSNTMRLEEIANLKREKKLVWHGVLQGKLLGEVLENDFMAAVE